MRYCLLCKKKNIPGNGKFFGIPLEKSRRAIWSKICKQDFKPSTRICFDHFSKDDVITAGSRFYLMPKAVPIVYQQEELALTTGVVNSPEQLSREKCQIVKNFKDAESQDEIKLFENESVIDSPNLLSIKNNIMPPQLEEEPLIQMPKEEFMQVPTIKSISCGGTTQTNTRLCGLVEASDFANEFRLNCFYCSDVYPMEKWKTFVEHLNNKHISEEEAFKVPEYVSEDHNYTPISLLTTPTEPAIETVTVINAGLRVSSLMDPLETTDNVFETVILNSNPSYTPHENLMPSNHINILNNFNKPKNNAKQTVLSRCLKRTNVEEIQLEEKMECKLTHTEIEKQLSTEITFEYTPREIVDLLLDSMKNYPILWRFDDKPFNEDIYDAAETLCKLINSKFSLNIDNLKMRRSINRILRFYCYFFPNEDNEMNEQFTCYYNKCALFLPTSRNEIAYARCSHCYICYRNDFDLKLHLFEEQKYLKWPFKCVQCKEVFRQIDEYEFHKHIPHYDEIFRCEPCNETFFRRAVYQKHIADCHPNVRNEPGRYKCNICGKAYYSQAYLNGHKKMHGERKYKCRLCPKSFTTNGKLAKHSKRHGKDYDFICEICGKGFFSQSSLNVHFKKHTGEKVTCSICNLKLRKSSLGRHLRLVHVPLVGIANLLPTGRQLCRRLIKPSLSNSLQKKRGEDRKYQCKICKINFENYKLIVEHNKEFHSDLPTWLCQMCTNEFGNKIYLKRHYRRKHKLHTIQIYKLVHENEDLNAVLAMEKELLLKLAQSRNVSKDKADNETKSDVKNPTKSHLLPDEVLFEVEKIHSSTIQDEIMQVADNIETQEMKVNNFNDFFTDLLK